jgi:hypothetical protein
METENIKGWDWCPACRNDVDEWLVSIERCGQPYHRTRRCPHCNAKCPADRRFWVSFLCLPVEGLGLMLLIWAVETMTGMRTDLIMGGHNHSLNLIESMFTGVGIGLTWMAGQRLYWRWVHRNRLPRKPDQSTEKYPTDSSLWVGAFLFLVWFTVSLLVLWTTETLTAENLTSRNGGI